jgi:hypothetical protein
MSEYNKTQKIVINDSNLDQDKHIFIKLEQDVKQLEVLSLKIDQKNIYQSFNADYGVLIGRVTSINNIGVPNAKISIFLPLDDEDSLNPDIVSIYPYKTPEYKDINGKKYNLLPRVSEFNQNTGTFKPKQPFGTFPSKAEILSNEDLLYVYKKYYKYTAVTNEFGDYMIFGIDISKGNVKTVHMSVDITDIGKYSMTPSSMVTNLGYSTNLFTNNNTKIKESNNLDDLPHIFLQNIAVNIVPFWGTEDFEIGFTRQDFKIKCRIEQNFTIFGTSFTHGKLTSIGTPDRSLSAANSEDDGFYRYTNYQGNTSDIRVQRTANPIIRLFSYSLDTSIFNITGNTLNLDYNKQIFEVPKEQYFEYNNEFGNFVLNVPCNRLKQVVDNQGNIINVDDNSSYGSFTKFFGFITFEYPTDLSIDATFAKKYEDGPSIGHIDRSKIKIPSERGLLFESENDDTNQDNNNAWRHEYFMFEGNKFYGVSQFLPTKWINNNQSGPDGVTDSTNRFDNRDINNIGGLFFRIGGNDEVSQTDIDNDNYLINPSTGTTYLYDLSPNMYEFIGSSQSINKGFGGQWLNLCLILPNYTWAFRGSGDRDQNVADFLFDDYKSTFFVTDNTQKLFANITNSKGFLSGFANTTQFIEIPSTEISKIYFNIPNKGINISLENENITNPELRISPDYFKFRAPNFQTDARAYNISAYDINYPYTLTGNTNQSAYLFLGMRKGNCLKNLFDLNLL